MTLAMTGGIGALSMPAFAASDAPPTVTVNGVTWVQVSNASQLEYIDQNQSSYLSSNIELMGNIDLTGYTGWVPIGGNLVASYSGTFNGQGYLISGLTIDDLSDTYVGFFGETSGTIEGLGMDVKVDATGSHQHVGSLVGIQNEGSITDSYAAGSVTGASFSENGGLVGVQGGGSITDSYATGSVTGAWFSENGGLVGVQGGGSITDSYATGSVTGASYSINGGLVGNQRGGSITDSYATGSVTGVGFSMNGGLVGGPAGASISASFFDQDTTSQSSGVGGGGSSGVTGESTQAMTTETTFTEAGWDFTHTWGISATVNSGYPYLLDSTLNSASTEGQMPEVPFAGALPVLGIAGLSAWAYAKKRKV